MTSQSWRPVARLSLLMNARYISANYLEIFMLGIKQVCDSLEKLELTEIFNSAHCIFLDFLELAETDFSKPLLRVHNSAVLHFVSHRTEKQDIFANFIKLASARAFISSYIRPHRHFSGTHMLTKRCSLIVNKLVSFANTNRTHQNVTEGRYYCCTPHPEQSKKNSPVKLGIPAGTCHVTRPSPSDYRYFPPSLPPPLLTQWLHTYHYHNEYHPLCF
jgi:hypothetical protein